MIPAPTSVPSRTNQPIEIGSIAAFFPSQTITRMVIARANTPSAPVSSTKIRYVLTGALTQPIEYFDYQTPIMFGHNHEPGAMAVAAYSPFRPYLPEDFTSGGPSYIYFDSNANRLATPIVRQKPDVAAQDGGNNTFFSGDSAGDVDTQPNFYGTSAAAPHAAAIAALVLQARGGPGSVTQPQMRTILQRSGFSHDLDPYFASGAARTANGGKLSITIRANAGNFNLSDSRSLSTNDTRLVGVSYVGAASVATLSINLANANPTGGSEVQPQGGLVWDPRAPTTGFPFTVGTTTGALTAANVTGAFSGTPPAPASAGTFNQLDMTFAAGTFTGGSGFTFGCDRDEVRTQNTATPTSSFGNSADLWGAAVAIPAGTVTPGGATFNGTLSDGTTFNGTITNRVGKGYSPLDGYGFINAQDAVNQPLP